MSTATIERYAVRNAPTIGPAIALAGLTTLLLVRLVPDVSGKPLHEDEAVAGLVAARPLGDVLHTVVLDRGGAPLHFILAHIALALDPSAEALRWISVVFALATVPLCYDLACLLAGRSAGLTAATLAATSQLLTVYGTFGRMYSLFAFASALSADLFVRALERPGRRTALAAAGAGLLPLTVHPFGAFLVAAEAAAALWVWRARDLRAALPVIAVSALALPLLLADLRLSERYTPELGQDPAGGSSAGSAGLRALGGAAGGWGIVLAVFVVLAAIGAFSLVRRRPTFTAFACLVVSAPPVGLALAGAAGGISDRLGPRHFVFMLPLWIVLPRSISTGDATAVAAPATWLRSHLSPGDVLYPYSPVFLAALPTAAKARGYPREAVALARVARRTDDVPAVFVSLPLGGPVTSATVRDLRRGGVVVHASPSWLILGRRGPFGDGPTALAAAARMLTRAAPIVAVGAPSAQGYLQQLHGAACAALTRLDSAC